MRSSKQLYPSLAFLNPHPSVARSFSVFSSSSLAGKKRIDVLTPVNVDIGVFVRPLVSVIFFSNLQIFSVTMMAAVEDALAVAECPRPSDAIAAFWAHVYDAVVGKDIVFSSLVSRCGFLALGQDRGKECFVESGRYALRCIVAYVFHVVIFVGSGCSFVPQVTSRFRDAEARLVVHLVCLCGEQLIDDHAICEYSVFPSVQVGKCVDSFTDGDDAEDVFRSFA